MKYLILGAGPAGLTAANMLKDRGEEDFIVLEKESEAGGLCRSHDIGGYPIDIGGGHFLDTRKSEAQEYILRFMPVEEWNRYPRSTKIDIRGHIIDNPIEAHIWQLPIEEQVEYIKSVAYAGANIGSPMPEDFVHWIYWKLGDKIADDYMLPYNTKMFGRYLNELGTYWLYKLPTVNFEDTLLSCLERKMHGSYPAHTEFYYPKKYGFGEVWRRMGERVKDKIEYEVMVTKLDCVNRKVNDKYQADVIINSVPWTEFEEITGCPDEVKSCCAKLPYTSLEVRHFTEDTPNDYQWVYYPDLSLPYHRKFFRANYLEGSHGGYYETNMERVPLYEQADIRQESAESNHKEAVAGFGRIAPTGWKYINKYAYPCNTIRKPAMIKNILGYMASQKIYGVGRWGEWEHLNADVVVQHVKELLKG